MKKLIKYCLVCGIVSGMLFSCSSVKRMGTRNAVAHADVEGLADYCNSLESFKTLYIKGIDAEITIDEASYNARVSLYYLPDSLFLLTAVNSGFEIVRLGVTPDSTVYINRIDKMVYVIRNSPEGFAAPVLFSDLEHLINKQLICEQTEVERVDDRMLLVDRSEQDISRKIYFSVPGLMLSRFEFFHKKTGEYVVGEVDSEQKIVIYSNFIVDNLSLQAQGGKTAYNEILDVNLSVNKRKYNIIYL